MMERSTVDVKQVEALLDRQQYIADRETVMALFFAIKFHKPLLVEGPAGVGKTEIAKVLSQALDAPLIRLQCYEGLDANAALYEWNYQRQLLHLKLEEGAEKTTAEKEADIFSETFLLKRPLLDAITRDSSPVLLIDELDRADEAFESFLLEILSDWQISIPEIGQVKASHLPYVIITGNRTRDLSDAVRRRCFYLWIDYPSFEKELEIVLRKVPDIDQSLAEQICSFMEVVREEKLEKHPGIAETLDWARALAALHQSHLDPEIVRETLGIVFKDWDDIRVMKDSLADLFEKVGVRSRLIEE